MPRKIAKLTPPKTVFDWEAFNKLIADNGGITAVTQRAGTTRQGLGLVMQKPADQLPFQDPLTKVLSHLNLPPREIQKLFVKPKPKSQSGD